MKLKVLKEFFDRKEDKYVYPSKTPTIDREEKRAAELISAGVAEEYVEGTEPETAPAEPEQAETPAEEKPAKKGGKK